MKKNNSPNVDEIHILRKNNIELAKALTREKMSVRNQFEDKLSIEKQNYSLRKDNQQLREINKQILCLFENTVEISMKNFSEAKKLLQRQTLSDISASLNEVSNVSETANSLKYNEKESESLPAIPLSAVSPMISGYMIQRPTVHLQRIHTDEISAAVVSGVTDDVTETAELYSGTETEIVDSESQDFLPRQDSLSALPESEEDELSSIIENNTESSTYAAIDNPTVVIQPLEIPGIRLMPELEHLNENIDTENFNQSSSVSSISLEQALSQNDILLDENIVNIEPVIPDTVTVRRRNPLVPKRGRPSNLDISLENRVFKRSKPARKQKINKSIINKSTSAISPIKDMTINSIYEAGPSNYESSTIGDSRNFRNRISEHVLESENTTFVKKPRESKKSGNKVTVRRNKWKSNNSNTNQSPSVIIQAMDIVPNSSFHEAGPPLSCASPILHSRNSIKPKRNSAEVVLPESVGIVTRRKRQSASENGKLVNNDANGSQSNKSHSADNNQISKTKKRHSSPTLLTARKTRKRAVSYKEPNLSRKLRR